MSVPSDMRVAVLRGVRDLVTETRPVPEPGPREVLVRVGAVGTCGSDTHYYEEGRIGDFVVRAPLVLGHESAGEIVAVGDGTTKGHRAGQRVSLEPGVPCFTCRQCRTGRYNLCPEMRFFGTPPVDGAFAEYVVIHEAMAHPVPPSMSEEAAALLEPLSVGIWACRKGGVGPGSRVLITGAGPIGLIALQAARAFGAAEIVVTDVRRHRLDLAADMGADQVHDAGQGPPDMPSHGEADVLLECSGVPQPAAMRRVAPAGRIVLIGMGGDEVSLPLDRLQRREIEVTGTFRYANTWPDAIELAATGRVDLDRLVTHRFDLAGAEGALTVARRDETAVKPVVRP